MKIIRFLYISLLIVVTVINFSVAMFNYSALKNAQSKISEMRSLQNERHVEKIWINDVPYEIALDFEVDE